MENTITRLDGGWLKTCSCCCKRYESKREDSKYCGANCRKKAQRSRLASAKMCSNYAAAGDKIRSIVRSGDGDEMTLDTLRLEYQKLRSFLNVHGWLSEDGSAF